MCILATSASARAGEGAGGAPHLALVPNILSGDVSILDTRSHTEVARLPFGPRPAVAAMSSDGRFAYVATDGYGAPNVRIGKIDLSALAIVQELTLNHFFLVSELEISPNGRWLAAFEGQHSTLFLVDTATMTLRGEKQLCPQCDGGNLPLLGLVNCHFSDDSRFLYAGVPNIEAFYVVDLAACAANPDSCIVGAMRGPPTAGSPPYHDIVRRKGDDRYVLLQHPFAKFVRRFDVQSNDFLDLAWNSPLDWNVCDIEFLGRSDLLAASTVVQGDFDPDFVEVVDVETGTVVPMPCSETARHLCYNARLSELWSTCSTLGGCNPFRIDVFDVATLTRKTTIVGPGYLPDGSRPAFTQNDAYYYQPHWANDVVLVFDAVTKTFVTQIPVGSSPQNVYMQGDSTPEEY